jgi:glycosyltransferase involved in cell wall biosynthesis
MREEMISQGLNQDKIIVEHDAYNEDLFKADGPIVDSISHLLPTQKRFVTYIGRFVTKGKEKGILEIIKSSGEILKQFPEVNYLFVGGPLDRVPSYHKLIDSLQLERDRFLFIDKRPLEEVSSFIQLSDLLLMPFPDERHYRLYMSPLKLFEYMAMKKPIIATMLPSISDVVSSDDVYYVEAGSIEELSNATMEVLKDNKLSEKLASNSYQKSKVFTYVKRAERILRFVSPT